MLNTTSSKLTYSLVINIVLTSLSPFLFCFTSNCCRAPISSCLPYQSRLWVVLEYDNGG